MGAVDVAPVAGVVFAAVECGAALLLEAEVVFDQLEPVFEPAAALHKHDVFVGAADVEGYAVFDDAFGFGQLVEGNGLRLQACGKQQEGEEEGYLSFHVARCWVWG